MDYAVHVLQGEYIAPEKIEGVYMRSPLVAQVFLDGNSLEVCKQKYHCRKSLNDMVDFG